MTPVRVIAAMGAVLAAPAKVRLSRAQYDRRAGQLGEWRKGGVFVLDVPLSLKFGEELEVEDGASRLNGLGFEVIQPEAKPGKKPEAKPEVVAEAKPEGVTGAGLDLTGADAAKEPDA